MNAPADITPLEQPAAVLTQRRRLTIGLPSCRQDRERRFPLTPEGATILTERGFEIRMEQGAAAAIRYDDARYERCGAIITSRSEALACDIVISMAPLSVADIRMLRRGALLLTLLRTELQTPAAIRELMRRHIIAIALDLITDDDGNTPFAGILSEIEGRAAMTAAATMLTDLDGGKGILLGGIAGIIPCEVTVIGSGIAARAVARAASGAGATVRMFDSNVYSLRRAARDLGPWVITSAMHPNVLEHALRSADVVVVTSFADTDLPVGSVETGVMKSGVVLFDISSKPGRMFPDIPLVDCFESRKKTPHVCHINAGATVPRTAAMAMTNCLTTMMAALSECDGTANALRLLPGLQAAAYTFFGKVVNSEIAAVAGVRAVDINIFLTLS